MTPACLNQHTRYATTSFRNTSRSGNFYTSYVAITLFIWNIDVDMKFI